jgi:hypothetical protein
MQAKLYHERDEIIIEPGKKNSHIDEEDDV